jgi:hypothetical protein
VANEEEGYVDEGTLCFDTYWWCALVYLARQHPEIVIPIGGMFYEQFQPCLTRDQFRKAMIREHGLGGMSDDERIRVEAVAARASIAACRFLDSIVEARPAIERRDAKDALRMGAGNVEKSAASPPGGATSNCAADVPILAWEEAGGFLTIGDTTGCSGKVRIGTVPWAIMVVLNSNAHNTFLPLSSLLSLVARAQEAHVAGEPTRRANDSEDDSDTGGGEDTTQVDSDVLYSGTQLIRRQVRRIRDFRELGPDQQVDALQANLRSIRGARMDEWRARWIHWTGDGVVFGLRP